MNDSEGEIRVLCVDDDTGLVELTSRFLERSNDDLTAITETDAESGLSRLETEDVDCIVSDYDMPGMDGLEFLEAIRNEDGELPFILFTGKGSEEIASEAITAGVTDYLQKKLGTDQYVVLANRIENAVESYRTQRALERNELLFEAVFDDPNTFIAVMDPDGTVVDVNQTALEFVDAELDDVRGEFFWESPWWDHSTELVRVCEEWTRRAASGEYVEFEAEHYGFEEDYVVIDGTIRPVTATDDEVVALIAEGRDVKNQKARERQLDERNDQLEDIVSIVGDELEEPLEVATEGLEIAREQCACESTSDHFETVERAHDRIEVSAEAMLATAQRGR